MCQCTKNVVDKLCYMFMCICTFKGESVVHGVLSVVEELRAAPRFENDGKNGIINM